MNRAGESLLLCPRAARPPPWRHISKCLWHFLHGPVHKKTLCRLSSAKGVINAVPPLFTAGAPWRPGCLKWLLIKSYPLTGINRKALISLEYPSPIRVLRPPAWKLPSASLPYKPPLSIRLSRMAALSGKGQCVLLFVIAFFCFHGITIWHQEDFVKDEFIIFMSISCPVLPCEKTAPLKHRSACQL